MGKLVFEHDYKKLEGYHLLRNGGAFQTEERSGCSLGEMSSPEMGIMMGISSQ